MDGTGRDAPERVFFLSYARPPQVRRSTPRNRDDIREYPARFFDDVNEQVAALLGTGPGEDPGYMDLQTEPGAEWNFQLRRAVGTAQVFVPLLSKPWATSIWCQREQEAFSRRPVSYSDSGEPAEGQTAILPVYWAPLPQVPHEARLLGPVQWFSPNDSHDSKLRRSYEDHGVHGLMSLRMRQPYLNVVWYLARAIVQKHFDLNVAPGIPADWDEPGPEGGA